MDGSGMDNNLIKARAIASVFIKEYGQRYSSRRKEEVLPTFYRVDSKVIYCGNLVVFSDFYELFRSMPDGKWEAKTWDAQYIPNTDMIVVAIEGSVEENKKVINFYKSVVLGPDLQLPDHPYYVITDSCRYE